MPNILDEAKQTSEGEQHARAGGTKTTAKTKTPPKDKDKTKKTT